MISRATIETQKKHSGDLIGEFGKTARPEIKEERLVTEESS
jgi:hypothetical protein